VPTLHWVVQLLVIRISGFGDGASAMGVSGVLVEYGQLHTDTVPGYTFKLALEQHIQDLDSVEKEHFAKAHRLLSPCTSVKTSTISELMSTMPCSTAVMGVTGTRLITADDPFQPDPGLLGVWL
jgi:hypothetical protein